MKYVIWMTGFSGSGKTTLGKAFLKFLEQKRIKGYLLDGDILRNGLCSDLGFSEIDRSENIRRVAELARILTDLSVIPIVSTISPLAIDRNLARKILSSEAAFVEVHVGASLDVCINRDTKGLYNKARQGLIRNFTGIDSPYEPPKTPDVFVDTGTKSIEDSMRTIVEYLEERGLS